MSSTQKIGLMTATIVAMNAMIGAGIFSVPSALGASVGPAGLVTYAFVIVAVWCMGSAMAQLAHFYPRAGSFYVYARQWGGHKIGLLAAGLYLIGLVIAMGHLTQVIGIYLQHYFPSLSASALGLVALALLTIFNIVGVHLSQAGQMVLICTTVFPLIAVTVLCLVNGSWTNFVPFAPFGWRSVFSAARIVVFGFFGFEAAASLFHVVKDPERNVPRALVASILLVGMLYMFFVGAIIFAIPLYYFLNPYVSISDVLIRMFPQYPWLLELIHFSIFSAVLGTVHSMIWASGSLLTAFLHQCHGAGLKKLLDKGYITDRISVLVIAFGIFCSYVSLHDPDLFFDLTAMFIIAAFTLSMGALLLQRDKQSHWQKIQTIVGLLMAFLIFYFAAEKVTEVLVRRFTRVDAVPVKML